MSKNSKPLSIAVAGFILTAFCVAAIAQWPAATFYGFGSSDGTPFAPPPPTATVTNNNNSGPGSLREALEALSNQPGLTSTITIQAGLDTIDLRSYIEVVNGGTITLDGNSNIIQASMLRFIDCVDVTIHDVAVYLFCASASTDPIEVDGADHVEIYNCELFGGTDQTIQIVNCPDYSFHDNIVAYSSHGSAGFFGGGDGASGTVYQNLWAHQNHRPLFEYAVGIGHQLSNNVFYNYTNTSVVLSVKYQHDGTQDTHLDYVDNFHVGGPDRPAPSGTTGGYPAGPDFTDPRYNPAPYPTATYYADGNVFQLQGGGADTDPTGNDENDATRIFVEAFPSRPGDYTAVAANAGCTTRTFLGAQVMADYVGKVRAGVRTSLAYSVTAGGVGWDLATGAPATGDQDQVDFKWNGAWTEWVPPGPGQIHAHHFDLFMLQDRTGVAFTSGTADIRVEQLDTGAVLYELLNHPVGTPIVRGVGGTGPGVGYVEMDSLSQGGVLYLHRSEEDPYVTHSGPMHTNVRVYLTYHGTEDTTAIASSR